MGQVEVVFHPNTSKVQVSGRQRYQMLFCLNSENYLLHEFGYAVSGRGVGPCDAHRNIVNYRLRQVHGVDLTGIRSALCGTLICSIVQYLNTVTLHALSFKFILQ